MDNGALHCGPMDYGHMGLLNMEYGHVDLRAYCIWILDYGSRDYGYVDSGRMDVCSMEDGLYTYGHL